VKGEDGKFLSDQGLRDAFATRNWAAWRR